MTYTKKGGEAVVYDIMQLGAQFGHILNGKAERKKFGFSVSLQRNLHVLIQGRSSSEVLPVGASFESLDQNGHALNLAEITLLEEEIPSFSKSIIEQGLIVGALHNHWIFTQPTLMYLHIQSVEPPLHFARKLANAFRTLTSYPVQEVK
jgi:hypothetical protein